MTKRLLVLSLGLLLVFALVIFASTGDRLQRLPASVVDQAVQPPEASKDACQMTRYNGTPAWVPYLWSGCQSVQYFDPEVLCTGVPTYPFEIQSLTFPLYSLGEEPYPVALDVIVYDMAPSGLKCDGPGAELCRFSTSADSLSFQYPSLGTVTFPTPCCVDGPFFIGVEYIGAGSGMYPGVITDGNLQLDTCDQWFYLAGEGVWYEWYIRFGADNVGYLYWYVNGETNSGNCEVCDWQPGDPYKMHFPQLPDEAGWDVNATHPIVLADDWQCTEEGWVKDIHFWGSWEHDIPGEIMFFIVSIHRDIPAAVSPTGYSMPGEQLWLREIEDFGVAGYDPPTMEGWYDPTTGEIYPDDHIHYFQYNICLEEPDWFWQYEDTIYWLNIAAVLMDPEQTHWGWKSTLDRWNDDAVWAFDGEWEWIEIYEPVYADTVSNGFSVAIGETGELLWGDGTDYYGEGWYFYPWYDWWNIWFYDHPFTYDRFKQIHIEFPIQPYNTEAPSFVEVAINWSTDQWSIDNPGGQAPPLPGVDEDLYIGRHILISGENLYDYFIFDYVIPEYNPEWVSVDVRGYNFMLEWGTIDHACVPKVTDPQSLNLAFVITGEAPEEQGACCYDPTGLAGDEAACIITTQDYCENILGGVYMGDGTQCAGVQACCFGDGSCIDADSLCCDDVLGGIPQGPGTQCGAVEACCLNDGSCTMVDPLCCDDLGGVPQGPGTQCSAVEACCLGDGSCTMADPLCCDDLGGVAQGAGTQCTVLKPCCLPGGTCQMFDPICCDDQGGRQSPIGAATCLGDGNGNQIDDACEGGWQPGDPHKMHFPQLPDEDGWDVDAVYDGILCDDWTCSADGPVLDLHFWGSWRNGLEGQIIGFEFMIYSNIPEVQSPTGYSVPNIPLWHYYTEEFGIVPFDPQVWESWYDPETGENIPNDHQSYFQYNVYIPEGDALEQEKDSVYWLCILAHVTGGVEPGPYWGWKSSEDHHLDDAVYAHYPFMPEPLPPELWMELYEPTIVSNPIVNAFFVEVDAQGWVVAGAGENAYGDGWYLYEMYDWWNIWFYDHPFTYKRWKEISIEFDAFPREPGPAFIEVAVNWSTDLWSLERQDSMPPLPGVDEDLFIGRQTVFMEDFFEGHYGPFTYVIPEYNPEWVSVDVRGFNFIIPDGFIVHECVGPQSLDLSFVITGAEVCDCTPGEADGSGGYNLLDATYIINYLYKNGPPPTPYALCSGDADCNCSINLLDATYIINYLYKNGPPPCTCEQWLINCGPPLRK
jgi:hypothetical protein